MPYARCIRYDTGAAAGISVFWTGKIAGTGHPRGHAASKGGVLEQVGVLNRHGRTPVLEVPPDALVDDLRRSCQVGSSPNELQPLCDEVGDHGRSRSRRVERVRGWS